MSDFRVPMAEYVYDEATGVIALFASNRDALLGAAPEFRSLILDEISGHDARQPCWLCVVPTTAGYDVVVGDRVITEKRPAWWLAAKQGAS